MVPGSPGNDVFGLTEGKLRKWKKTDGPVGRSFRIVPWWAPMGFCPASNVVLPASKALLILAAFCCILFFDSLMQSFVCKYEWQALKIVSHVWHQHLLETKSVICLHLHRICNASMAQYIFTAIWPAKFHQKSSPCVSNLYKHRPCYLCFSEW